MATFFFYSLIILDAATRLSVAAILPAVVKVTETAIGCHVVISSPISSLYTGPTTTLFDGYANSVADMQAAIKTAESALAKLFNADLSHTTLTYSVTHTELDGTVKGPFYMTSSSNIESAFKAGTGSTFTQLCGGLHSCFHPNSTVITTKGKKTMAELHNFVGNIQILTSGGHFSTLKLWLHAEPQKPTSFLRINTSNGQSICLTRGHLMFKTKCDRIERQTIRAEKISLGDCLIVDNEGQLETQQVVKVDKLNSVGFYSPVTASGDLLVDNILVSAYSEVEAVQLQSKMFEYVAIVKTAAEHIFSANLSSRIFGESGGVTPIAEIIRQFLLLSANFT